MKDTPRRPSSLCRPSRRSRPSRPTCPSRPGHSSPTGRPSRPGFRGRSPAHWSKEKREEEAGNAKGKRITRRRRTWRPHSAVPAVLASPNFPAIRAVLAFLAILAVLAGFRIRGFGKRRRFGEPRKSGIHGLAGRVTEKRGRGIRKSKNPGAEARRNRVT